MVWMCASCVSFPSESVARIELVTPLLASFVLTISASRRKRSMSASGGTGATAIAAGETGSAAGLCGAPDGTAMEIAAARKNDAPMGTPSEPCMCPDCRHLNGAIVRKMSIEGKTDFRDRTFRGDQERVTRVSAAASRPYETSAGIAVCSARIEAVHGVCFLHNPAMFMARVIIVDDHGDTRAGYEEFLAAF